VDDAEFVVVFNEVLGKPSCVAIGPECVFMFVEPYCNVPSGLTHIRFVTYGTRKSVYS
jgi:hypothetical protein